MFDAASREQIRNWILERASSDARLTGGAITGSTATGLEDRYSDIDLAFGVTEGADRGQIFDDVAALVAMKTGVVHHFDMTSGPAIFRLFLLRGGLELDVGLYPASAFGAKGAAFRLVFGQEVRLEAGAQPQDHLIGLCWHHALHADAAIARGRSWQAEFYISALRDHAMELACARLGLPAIYARGTDKLPAEMLAAFEGALVQALDTAELRRALTVASGQYLHELRFIDVALSEQLANIFKTRERLGHTTS